MLLLYSQSKFHYQTISLPFCTGSTGCQCLLNTIQIYTLCYSSLSDSGPEYLSKVLQICTPSTQLHSSSDNFILCVPSIKTKIAGQRLFSFAGPMIWNKLHSGIHNQKSSFKKALKTHLFDVHYWITECSITFATNVAA